MAKRTKPPAPPAPPAHEPEDDLPEAIRHAVASDSPLDLLMLVSSVLAALEPREQSPFDDDPSEGSSKEHDAGVPTLSDFVTTLLSADEPEFTAVLAVLAVVAADEVTRTRARRELAKRRHELPAWLRELDTARGYRAVAVNHVLADGQNVMLGARLASGLELTALCYVDFNLGTLVKDAFVVDQPLEVIASASLAPDEPDMTVDEISLADAHARVREAIDTAAMTFPPLETETWPAARPLIEWLLRTLPGGDADPNDAGTDNTGTDSVGQPQHGYQRREYSEQELDELVEDFLGSPAAAGLAHDADERGLAGWLIWYASAFGPAEPLHWSPTSVEIVLLDALPRKVVAEVTTLAKAPAVIRGLIRFAHQRRGLRVSLTEQTLAAVDELEDEYQQAIHSPRPSGPAAMLAAMGFDGPDDVDRLGDFADLDDDGDYADDDDDDYDAIMAQVEAIVLDSLRRDVGSEAALQALDVAPLPDEPFDWSGIPDDIRTVVNDVLSLIDACCDELFDVEFRTACRRVLSRAAAGDPAVFRRRARADTAAAAVCWIIGKANSAFGGHASMHAKDLLAHFGLTGSVSQRAGTLLQACGYSRFNYGDVQLGSPDYLTSARRAAILESRDRFQSDSPG
jgi:hypothetical protein